jgi:hypothetical protein
MDGMAWVNGAESMFIVSWRDVRVQLKSNNTASAHSTIDIILPRVFQFIMPLGEIDARNLYRLQLPALQENASCLYGYSLQEVVSCRRLFFSITCS